MFARFLNSIDDISELSWNNLWPSDYPFTQHAFLAALETTGCTTKESGWVPCHLIIQRDSSAEFNPENILAIIPLYEKYHSYGEYVFDWAWADAYHRNGLEYYPKLLNAIPFTPSTGPRFTLNKNLSDAQKQECLDFIEDAINKKLIEIKGSSFHCLFPDATTRSLLSNSNHLERQGCQFHWFNQDYQNFDHFLEGFSSRKRKTLKKERKKVSDQNILIQFREAADISTEEWQFFYQLYHRTYFKRSGRAGYLSCDFFLEIAQAMPHQVLLATAHSDTIDQPMIAAALYFKDSTTLYGRYWGTIEDIDGLHFETCYYQGIEYAIQHKLKRFDPGAQGEHKIQRGFTPVLTSSYHRMVHQGFAEAISEFITEEKKQNFDYCIDGRKYLPFKDGITPYPEPSVLLTGPPKQPIS